MCTAICRRTPGSWILALVVLSLGTSAVWAQPAIEAEAAAKEVAPAKVQWVKTTLAQGRLELSVPANWKPAKLASRILEREFAIPAAKGDQQTGRLTMMRSGGSVKQNVERWYTQFSQPDGKSTKDIAKVTEKKFNGQSTTVVDIHGSYAERKGGGPFGGGKVVQQPNYRMLGGIVQTKQGQYFFKLYGPEKTIDAAEKPFLKMLESVRSK